MLSWGVVPDIGGANASMEIDSFWGTFVVFVAFLLFFHVFCLVVKRKLVYLQTDSTEAEIRTYGR